MTFQFFHLQSFFFLFHIWCCYAGWVGQKRKFVSELTHFIHSKELLWQVTVDVEFSSWQCVVIVIEFNFVIKWGSKKCEIRLTFNFSLCCFFPQTLQVFAYFNYWNTKKSRLHFQNFVFDSSEHSIKQKKNSNSNSLEKFFFSIRYF